ncbi:MAG: hypothetical protein MUO31_02390 [Thermodesulfovibrionales bacterium]|nr:hypothetical protein [Thermodesulfovibrionales bacterium]
MKFLWDLPRPLWKASYETLKFEWVDCWGSNEPRFVVRYLGRPATINRSSWTSRRASSNTGNVAQFLHADDRPVTAKTGLMQIRGYITFDKQTKMFNIHHELMPYYTEQTCLKLANPQPEVNEESQSSILDACVCTLLDKNEDNPQTPVEGEWGNHPLGAESPDGSPEHARGDSVRGGRRRERESIGDTHTRESPKIMLPSIPDMPTSILGMPKLTHEGDTKP